MFDPINVKRRKVNGMDARLPRLLRHFTSLMTLPWAFEGHVWNNNKNKNKNKNNNNNINNINNSNNNDDNNDNYDNNVSFL